MFLCRFWHSHLSFKHFIKSLTNIDVTSQRKPKECIRVHASYDWFIMNSETFVLITHLESINNILQKMFHFRRPMAVFYFILFQFCFVLLRFISFCCFVVSGAQGKRNTPSLSKLYIEKRCRCQFCILSYCLFSLLQLKSQPQHLCINILNGLQILITTRLCPGINDSLTAMLQCAVFLPLLPHTNTRNDTYTQRTDTSVIYLNQQHDKGY